MVRSWIGRTAEMRSGMATGGRSILHLEYEDSFGPSILCSDRWSNSKNSRDYEIHFYIPLISRLCSLYNLAADHLLRPALPVFAQYFDTIIGPFMMAFGTWTASLDVVVKACLWDLSA